MSASGEEIGVLQQMKIQLVINKYEHLELAVRTGDKGGQRVALRLPGHPLHLGKYFDDHRHPLHLGKVVEDDHRNGGISGGDGM